MAKDAKIFCRQSGVGDSNVYTVPLGKFVVANASWSGSNAGNSLRVDGATVLAVQSRSEKGLVFPAGTAFGLQMSNGSGVISGFEYDANLPKEAKIFCKQSGAGNSAIYTVPVGKFVVANVAWSGSGSANALQVDGATVLAAQSLAEKGLAFPAGTAFGLQMSNGAGIVTGFEFEA